MALEVYADEHGIGIFDTDWPKYPELGHADLRLDSMDSFFRFVYALLTAANKMD